MLKLLVILAIAPAIFAQTPVKPCGKGQQMPKAVYFGGKANYCTKAPCELKRGKTGISEIDFVSPINTKSIMPKAKTKVFGMQIDLDLGVHQASAACKLLTKGCPLQRGDLTTFKLAKVVEKNAMTGTADVEYSLVGDNNQVIFCYKLKTIVV